MALKYPQDSKNPIRVDGLRNVAAFSLMGLGKLKKRFRSALLKIGGSSNIACSLLFKMFILGIAKPVLEKRLMPFFL